MTSYETLKLYKEGKISLTEAKKLLKEEKENYVSNIIYLKPAWEEAGLDELVLNQDIDQIIVFGTKEEQIALEGCSTIYVYKGDSYQKKSEREYECNPFDKNQLETLWKTIGRKKNYVVYMWKEQPDNANASTLIKDSEPLFLLLKTIMKQGAGRMCHMVLPYDEQDVFHVAFGGLAKSVAIENPGVKVHTVSIPKHTEFSHMIKNEILYFNENEVEIKYENTNFGVKRFVRNLKLIEQRNEGQEQEQIIYKDKTILITGGAGGLGLLFAKYFAKKGAKEIILTGRSKKLSSDETFERIRKYPVSLIYQQLDVCDETSMKQFAEMLKEKHIHIDGIIHSAGVLRDSYMIKKELEMFLDVLKPKVAGLHNLVQNFKDQPLDFFVTFSSIVGVLGNAGQADYATANCFMDNYMESISTTLKNWNRCVSINWPFWANGGMELSQENLNYMAKKYGLYPIAYKDGIRAFEFSLESGLNQVSVVNGDQKILSEYIPCLKEENKTMTVSMEKKPLNEDISDELLKEKVIQLLKKLISEETKTKIERISIQVPVEKYGLDSIMTMNISSELESVFGPLRKTLLFEYISIDLLSNYFLEEHRESIIKNLLSEEEKQKPSKEESVKAEKEIYTDVMEEQHAQEEHIGRNDIAIIGIAGKYPMAEDLEELWDNLCAGKDCITPVPEDRWIQAEDKKQWGGFISDADKFDPLIFDISYKEASMIDPTERIFMETVWSALENAGYTKRRLSKSNVGVFVGAMYANYEFYGVEEFQSGDAKPLSSSFSSIANRISYFYNFHGPSLTVDTMCSSSLTALHIAVKSLEDGDCDCAVVGGVNLSLHPYKYFILEENNFTSSDGRCRSFGEGGDGYVPGEGSGAIIIKPLEKAIQDHDLIHAVIKGTSINHGGHVGGFTVPNPNMQSDVIRKALGKAEVDPATIRYIEAHGTGTHLGDPIEIAGLEKAFAGIENRNEKCAIGSIKSNIGHLEAAAGIAGITKVVLQMEHEKLVPSIHAEKLNQEIDFSSSAFQVQRALEEWNPKEVQPGVWRRRAGVSSFGAGGSNAHVIMEDYLNKIAVHVMDKNVVVLSARTQEQLMKHIQRIAEFIRKRTDHSKEAFTRFCYTLQQGREQLFCRYAVVCNGFEQLYHALEEYIDNGRMSAGAYIGNVWESNSNIDDRMDVFNNVKKAEQFYQAGRYDDIARFWCNGAELDWGFLYQNQSITPLPAPSLPFEKVRLWIPENRKKTSFRRELTNNRDRIIRDHVVKGVHIAPAAYIIELFAAAADKAMADSISVRNLKLYHPIVVDNSGTKIKIDVKSRKDTNSLSLKLCSEDGEILYASCEIRNEIKENSNMLSLHELDSYKKRSRNKERCYSYFEQKGYHYGETLRLIQTADYTAHHMVAYLDTHRLSGNAQIVKPELLDAAFQTTILFAEYEKGTNQYIPISVDEITIEREDHCNHFKIVSEMKNSQKARVCDLDVYTDGQKRCISIRGLQSSNVENIKSAEEKKRTNKIAEEANGNTAKSEKVKKMLIHLISEELTMPAAEITPQIGFERIGINSISSSGILMRLDEMFPNIPRTLFYENNNINELTQYLMENYKDIIFSHNEDENRTEKEETESTLMQQNDEETSCCQDIAIIGISGKYPMASNLTEYWSNLLEGRDCVTTIPKERWNLEQYFDEDKDAELKHYSKWGGFLEHIDEFDPMFFNIAPSQAAMLDPQERLFLQTAWECVEDAGYTPEALGDQKVGVYVGVMWGLYHMLDTEISGRTLLSQTTFSSIANRVSYCMNFDGPSMAIDTMCSSSITAIHLACEAIKSGEIQEAIAGGVNLSVHPSKYIQLCQGKFLSTDGRCRSFGEGGDGYVPGEGVGAIMLKALPKAVEDHDHIYGIIKGSSINHGGHSNGYTVPNGKKQVEVMTECMKKAHVGIEDISYVEAHGTGTELGDPIEVSSVSKVLAGRKAKCPIGSVKSNIGHLEAAAGIAAVTKVLLQMKYQKLVPSIHTEELNHNINFDTVPVTVQRTVADWNVNGDKKIAAVNAFGAGGSNGCLIIEEYNQEEESLPVSAEKEQQIFVLSARDQEQLAIYSGQLLNFMKQNRTDLMEKWHDIIFTLQQGRKAFEYRLAIVCDDFDDAINKLEKVKSGENDRTIFEGYTSEKQILMNMERTTGQSADFIKCAKDWAEGNWIDWSKVNHTQGSRCSLPVYPFVKGHYYANIPNALEQGKSTPSLRKFRFEKTINRKDSIIAEHVMGGHVLLPGTYFIVFAMEMFQKAFPGENVVLYEINWKEPFEMQDGEHEKNICIEFKKEEPLDFEIFYMDKKQKQVCVTGKAKMEHMQSQPAIDIDTLQREVSHGVSDEEMYGNLSSHGYEYGTGYKRTTGNFFSQNEAFASVSQMYGEQAETTDYYAQLLDAGIRTSLWIAGNLQKSAEPLRIPFYLEEFRIYGSLNRARYVYAYSDEMIKNDATKKCDVVIADEEGRVIAFFSNLVSRVLSVKKENEISYVHSVKEAFPMEIGEETSLQDVIVFNPSGQKTDLEGKCRYEIGPGAYDREDKIQEILQELRENEKQIHKFIFISTCADELETFDFERIMTEVVYLTNVLRVVERLEGEMPIQFIYYGMYEKSLNPYISTIQSYFISFVMVNSRMRFSVVAIKREESFCNLLSGILSYELEHIDTSRKEMIEYREGKKWIPYLKQFEIHKGNSLLKENGMYLIVGGCGKIGQTISGYCAAHYHANLILTGRSPMNENIKEVLAHIRKLGGKAQYVQADVCNRAVVNQLIEDITDKYGNLNGVINMAGSTSGKSILEASEADMRTVLASKIAGTENLDFATRNQKLDFFLTFSSISCVMGDYGECCYSMANKYLNQCMERREYLRKEGKRYGESISISWPLFGDGGFELPEDKKNIYFKYMGMSTLSNDEVTQIFENILTTGNGQVMVFCGDARKIGKMLKFKEEVEIMEEHTSDLPDSKILESRGYKETVQYLKKILAECAGISVNRIKEDETFERYGIDSIMIMDMNRVIDKDFPGVTKTLFFEYNNIHDLAQYFIEHHRERINDFFQLDDKGTDVPSQTVLEQQQNVKFQPKFIELAEASPARRTARTESKKMAIIGVSGRFPKADNIEEFWEVLKNGMDCIEKIPEERWSIEKYYSEDKEKEGKTYSKWGGFVKDADKFDPLFFNIAPYQAEKMDPQERIFLETAWSTVEDAGYTPEKLKKNAVGVFVGAMYAHYQMLAEDEYAKGNLMAVSSYLSSIANRVSYAMDFDGPSVTVDTACSSALEAIRLGCLNIQNGDCDMALVGGVNLSLHPQKYIFLCQSNFLASDGKCHSYGDGGDGYVPGEGVGAILIKPLEAAERDHDHIYAVINSIAANHGGRTNGYTVPNPNAQSEVIKKALEKGNINPETVSYIEGHGTGTILGDPIEVTGLSKAFHSFTQKRNFCALGSAKANIGHLESAAGIAGVIKILLQMKYKMIPPLAGVNELNPNIHFEETPFYVPKELTEWKRPVIYQNGSMVEVPLRAGINAFGAGGANVHLELEEYEEREAGKAVMEPYAIVLSAKSSARLQEYAKRLAEFIESSKIEYVEEDTEKHDIKNKVQQMIADCLDLPYEVVEGEDDLLELGADQVIIQKIKNVIQKEFHKDVEEELIKSRISIQNICNALGSESPKRMCKDYTIRLDELAYTLQTGRESMEYRLGFMASDLDDVTAKLQAFALQEDVSDIAYNDGHKKELELDLFSDEDSKEILELFIHKKRFHKLVALWVNGVNIDWEMLYHGRSIRKMSMPTYPFDRKRYYLNMTDTIDSTVTTGKQEKKQDTETQDKTDYTYGAEWVVDTEYEPSHTTKWNSVLICYHHSAADLAKTLGDYHKGAEVKYYEFGTDDFLVKTPLKTIERVYFIGDVEFHKNAGYSEQNSLTSLKALFALLKVAYKGNRPKSICVLSNMAYLVNKDNVVNPFAGGTYGFIHSVEKEYTDISFSYFDLDVYKKDEQYEETYALVLMPFICGTGKESLREHAVRDGYFYRREIFPVMLPEQDSVLKEKGVYVICGGMGSVGQDLTKYLLSKYHASVVIIGKREQDSERSAVLKEIEQSGGELSYCRCDLCQLEEVASTLKTISEKYGRIDGIFNSTMVFHEISLSEMKKQEFEETVRIKIAGNANILAAIDNLDVGFVMIFSSVQAFNGNQGRCHYSAACDLADQFVQYMGTFQKCPVKIINWGYWGSHNGQVLVPEYVEGLNQNGIYQIDPMYGMKTIEKVLSSSEKQVLVFRVKQFVLDLMGVKERKSVQVYRDVLEYETYNHYEIGQKMKQDIDEFCCVGAMKVLQSLGLFNSKTEVYEKEAIYQKVLKQDTYKQLMDAIIAIVVKGGYVTEKEAVFSGTKKISNILKKKIDQYDQIIDDGCEKYKEIEGYFALLKCCVQEMPEVIKGNKRAEEVLYPDSSMELVEGVYKKTDLSEYLNQMLAVAIHSYIRQRIPYLVEGEKITILEIGTGTGSTSEVILEQIAQYGTFIRYICSDRSKELVTYEQDMFQDKYPFAEFVLLDVDQDLRELKNGLGNVDVVFGTNVSHRTKSIQYTVSNIRNIMKENGLFMLNEGVQSLDILTLTFGMLTEWWQFDDKEIRIPNSPMLTSKSWIKVLGECGYTDFLDMKNVVFARTDGKPVETAVISEVREQEEETFTEERKKGADHTEREEKALLDESIEQKITRIFMEVLKLDLEDIELDRKIMDYGVDSILAVKIISRISETCNIDIGLDTLFDCETIEGLAEYIKNNRE